MESLEGPGLRRRSPLRDLCEVSAFGGEGRVERARCARQAREVRKANAPGARG